MGGLALLRGSMAAVRKSTSFSVCFSHIYSMPLFSVLLRDKYRAHTVLLLVPNVHVERREQAM